jgi:hypothetical protein
MSMILLQRAKAADAMTIEALAAAVWAAKDKSLADEIIDQSRLRVCDGLSDNFMSAAGEILLERFPPGPGGVGHANHRTRMEMERSIPLLFIDAYGRHARLARSEY